MPKIKVWTTSILNELFEEFRKSAETLLTSSKQVIEDCFNLMIEK